MPSPLWFILQVSLSLAAAVAAPAIARRSPLIWQSVAGVAFGLLLLWPLMRVFPVEPVTWFGPELVAHLELTGQAVPAALLLGILARHVPQKRDGRAIAALLLIAAVYFIKAGWWMVGPGVPDLGREKASRLDAKICMQTTDYTCVAASMVTLCRANGLEATETEMARLANIEVGSGATDSRAILGLQRKLAGTGLAVHYRRLDLAGLIAAPKPCLVQLDWSYFISHMVPVMDATETRITIGDPLMGSRSVFTAEFMKLWKRQAIVVETGP